MLYPLQPDMNARSLRFIFCLGTYTYKCKNFCINLSFLGFDRMTLIYLIYLIQGRTLLEANYPIGPFGTKVCFN